MTRHRPTRTHQGARHRSARTRYRFALIALGMLVPVVLLGPLLGPVGQASAIPVSAAPGTTAAIPAFAPVGTGNLVITLSRLSPAIPKPGSTLDARGTITNVSDAVVANVYAALRISPTPLYNRSEIMAVMSGQTTREGIQVQATLTQLAAELGPGQQVEFHLSLPLSQVSLPRSGAYVFAVEALGDSGAGMERQALLRTFIPWWPTGTHAEPLGLTMLWPLTGPPERDSDGVYLNDDLAIQMSVTGRLDSLLAAASKDPDLVTWVVDPQLVQAASGMSNGYQINPDPNGATQQQRTGTRGAEARRWLDNLVDALSNGAPALLGSLYGNPDVDAAKHGKALGNLLSQRRTADLQMSATLNRNPSGVLVIAPGGNATPETISALDDAGITGVALSDTAMPEVAPGNYTPTGSAVLPTTNGQIPVLLLDSGLQSALAMPATSESEAIALRQRMLAETEIAALEAPSQARILVACPQADWAPSQVAAAAALRALKAPWVVPITATSMLATPESNVPRTHVALSEGQLAAQLPAPSVAQVRVNQRGVTEYRSLVTSPNDISMDFQQAPARQLSSYFRGRQPNWAALSQRITEQVAAAVGSVSVVSSGSVTISGESGTIPVTVSNDGQEEVTVGLKFSSRPPQLFQADPVDPFPIAPGRLTSIEVKAQVAGSANVPVEIQLVGADGRAIGEPTVLVVRSAAYAKAARVIVQLSLFLLVLAVLVHGVRRAKRAIHRHDKQTGQAS